MRAALDAAVAVDGDAQWNAAIDAAEKLLSSDYAYEAAKLVRSLKRG